MHEIQKDIRKIVANVFQQDPEVINRLGSDDNLTQYGMDSITSIDLVVALEEMYHFTFNEEDLLLENIDTLAKLENILITHSKKTMVG